MLVYTVFFNAFLRKNVSKCPIETVLSNFFFQIINIQIKEEVHVSPAWLMVVVLKNFLADLPKCSVVVNLGDAGHLDPYQRCVLLEALVSVMRYPFY